MDSENKMYNNYINITMKLNFIIIDVDLKSLKVLFTIP